MSNPLTFLTSSAFIQNSSYFLIFLIMVFEGPIVTIIAASAASAGLFNIYLIFSLSLLGNIVGDLVYFYIGKIGHKVFLNHHLKYFGITKKKVKSLETILKTHTVKAMLAIKLIPNLGGPGLIAAGAINLQFKKFIKLSFIISFCYSLFFTLVGFYIGIAFINILNYFNHVAWIILFLVIIILVLFIIYNQILKRARSLLKIPKK